MNKRCFIYLTLILVVLMYQSSALRSSVKAAAHLEEMLKKNPACKQIKCPTYSDPMCVRLKYVTSALEANTVYVLMINRCEIKYATCYEGVVAKEVPMKYCDHGKNIFGDLKKLQERRWRLTNLPGIPKNLEENNEKKTASVAAVPIPVIIRRKRGLRDHSHIDTEDDVKTKSDRNHIIEEEELNIQRDREMEHLNKAKQQLFENEDGSTKKKDKTLRNLTHTFHIYLKDENGVSRAEMIDGGLKVQNLNKLHGNPTDNNGDNDANEDVNEDEKDVGNNEIGDKDVDQPQGDISDRIEYIIHSGEEKLEDVNMEQYAQQCPTTCPARGVMSCSKCTHGIYRTFLSPCHMRMFDCGHPEEKLTVVAWAPCAMSGPYLDDLQVPVGRIDEPNDEDVVLQYLKCMEYAGQNLKPYSTLNCTEFEGLGKRIPKRIS